MLEKLSLTMIISILMHLFRQLRNVDLTISACTRSNGNPSYTLVRSGSRSAPTSQYTPSCYGGGGSLRRKVMKRNNPRAPRRIQSTYQEEGERYVSGKYEDGPCELMLVCVKVYIVHVLLPSNPSPSLPLPPNTFDIPFPCPLPLKKMCIQTKTYRTKNDAGS